MFNHGLLLTCLSGFDRPYLNMFERKTHLDFFLPDDLLFVCSESFLK